MPVWIKVSQNQSEMKGYWNADWFNLVTISRMFRFFKLDLEKKPDLEKKAVIIQKISFILIIGVYAVMAISLYLK